jgi:hypothetical protein
VRFDGRAFALVTAPLMISLALVAGLAIAAYAQDKCPSAADFQNAYDEERVRHGGEMTTLKNARDQLLAEQRVAQNNCPRGDNNCLRSVRESFAPKLAEVKNKETLENSYHSQVERKMGQMKRDCKLYDRIERRSKP